MTGVYDRKTDMFVQVVPENYEDVFLAVRPEQALQCAAWDDPNAADDMCREGERLPEAAGRDLVTWYVPEPEADKAGGKPDKPDWQFPETVTREMLESFIQTKEGSTRPMVGKIDGHKYIVKFGDSTGDDHVRCEVEGDRFIRAAGFNAPRSRIYEVDWWGKGKNTTIRLSEYIEDAVALKDAYKYFPEWNWKVKQQLLAAYPVLAVMANTDAFHNDNVLVDARGNVWYVDNGSSFCYRATGSLKLPKTGFSYNYFKRTDPKAAAKDGGIMSLYEYSDQLKTILGRRCGRRQSQTPLLPSGGLQTSRAHPARRRSAVRHGMDDLALCRNRRRHHGDLQTDADLRPAAHLLETQTRRGTFVAQSLVCVPRLARRKRSLRSLRRRAIVLRGSSVLHRHPLRGTRTLLPLRPRNRRHPHQVCRR